MDKERERAIERDVTLTSLTDRIYFFLFLKIMGTISYGTNNGMNYYFLPEICLRSNKEEELRLGKGHTLDLFQKKILSENFQS